MKMIDGFCWPDGDTVTPRVVLAEIRRLPQYLALVPKERRRVCVQAGGNVGVYPVALSKHFEQVFTFEPDPENWECLRHNTRGRPNVLGVRAAVGCQTGRVTTWRTAREAGNYGATRVRWSDGADSAPCLRLGDELKACDQQVDFLMLDVEGYEQPALEGAERLIALSHPVISVELKGLGAPLGWPDEHTKTWLEARGYSQVAQIGNDKVFAWTPS